MIVFSVLAVAGTINVPADYPKIQQAILAASNGDTVLVAPGTYYENINFRGRRIVVTSWYALDHNPAYINSTIIDGSQPADPDTASCVLFISGEDTTAIIQGFTLTGGTGTAWKDEHSSGTYREGGGILSALSSPTIQYNVIKYNEAYDKTGLASAGGGGIRCGDGYPRIYNNIIMYNKGRYGAGIVLNYTGAIIKNNVIYRNSGGEDYAGSGIWANSNGLASKLCENNTVVENSSVLDGGGFWISGTSMTIKNTIIWGNTAPSDPQITVSSGMVYVSYSDIQGGWTGTGNINSAPQFADTSHYLAPGSPCIDAGDPAAQYNDNEDASNPGNARHPSRGLVRNDIGAYGGRGCMPAPYVDLHLNDPLPPSNMTASSDYLTPSSVQFTWTDPVTTNDGLPLSNFRIHLYREGMFLAEVDSGVQQYTDNGLALHQQYTYTINTVVPDDSSLFDTVSVYCGGAAQPNPVSLFSVVDDTDGVWLYWRNPVSQIDGTSLNDLAYILIYRDDNLIDSVAQTMADTGQSRSYFDTILGYHRYRVQVRDNETPLNTSESSPEIFGYGGLLKSYDEGFELGPGSLYRTGTWDTTGLQSHQGMLSLTDSPVGNYPLATTSYVLLPPVVLGDEPILQFYDIAIVRAGSFVYVDISNDRRKTFTTLKSYNASIHTEWQDGIASPSDWMKEFINLKSYAGDTVTVRFRIFAGSGIAWDGWYIDDITISDAAETITTSDTVQAGWNLLSLPVRAPDCSVTTVFPPAVSKAFSFTYGYIPKDTIEPGNGYFLKFDSSRIFSLTGSQNWNDTVTVSQGWNLVGCLTFPIGLSQITTIPSGIIQSGLFGFNGNGYTTETQLLPGKAYWLKVSKNGKIVMVVLP